MDVAWLTYIFPSHGWTFSANKLCKTSSANKADSIKPFLIINFFISFNSNNPKLQYSQHQFSGSKNNTLNTLNKKKAGEKVW